MTLYLGRTWQSWLLTLALQSFFTSALDVHAHRWGLLVGIGIAWACLQLVPATLTFRSRA